ncbi:hypothetical protein C8J57DRAFT_1232842 [Mycena rebaudengoi]|nr:hypothetical protein C8J57DRAFT_1232842 [Mycena rebaudengoi]
MARQIGLDSRREVAGKAKNQVLSVQESCVLEPVVAEVQDKPSLQNLPLRGFKTKSVGLRSWKPWREWLRRSRECENSGAVLAGRRKKEEGAARAVVCVYVRSRSWRLVLANAHESGTEGVVKNLHFLNHVLACTPWSSAPPAPTPPLPPVAPPHSSPHEGRGCQGKNAPLRAANGRFAGKDAATTCEGNAAASCEKKAATTTPALILNTTSSRAHTLRVLPPARDNVPEIPAVRPEAAVVFLFILDNFLFIRRCVDFVLVVEIVRRRVPGVSKSERGRTREQQRVRPPHQNGQVGGGGRVGGGVGVCEGAQWM